VHAPHLAPGEIAAERNCFSDVLLVDRLRNAIARLNPAVPSEACEEAQIRFGWQAGTSPSVGVF
jgi:type I restriction enzyme R subunit